MGYESRIYIVEKTSFTEKINNKVMHYAIPICSFDLCKCYGFAEEIKTVTDCYFYEGNEKIIEDKYNKPLTETSVDDAIRIIEECIEKYGYYRRFNPLLQMLKAFKEDEKSWDGLYVLHYGY